MARLRMIAAFALLSGCSQGVGTAPHQDELRGGFTAFLPERSSMFGAGPEAPIRSVLATSDEWEMLWGQLTANELPVRPAPDIDFSRFSLVVASRGRVSDSGHSIVIQAVEDRPDSVVIHLKEIEYGGLCTKLLQHGYAVAMGLVAKSSKPYLFSVTQESRGCGADSTSSYTPPE